MRPVIGARGQREGKGLAELQNPYLILYSSSSASLLTLSSLPEPLARDGSHQNSSSSDLGPQMVVLGLCLCLLLGTHVP